MSLEVSKNMWFEMIRECREAGYKKLLIEESLSESLTMPETFELILFLVGLKFGCIKFAFVDRCPSHADVNRFGELAGANRGLNGKMFQSKREAEKWLLGH
ncbi:MAG: hypothetical protein R2747_23765 [Pyrinomonadaceae bacterium]